VIHEAGHLKTVDTHINLVTTSAEMKRGKYYIAGEKFLSLKKEKAVWLC
jgi:small nuclear ribonucleoprotein (snRNP)-like protein